MYSTYKSMCSCTTKYYLDKDLEDLCTLYRGTCDAGKRNKIYAAMFCNLFPMMLKIQSKYYSLTNEQKVEHALWHLLRSIRYYKNNGKVKFATFFHTHFTNQMKTLLSTQNNLKNAAFTNIVKDNQLAMKNYSNSVSDKAMEHTDWYMTETINNSKYLSSEEKLLMNCMNQGFVKSRDIAYEMNRITNPMRKIIDEKAELRKVRKIKQNIKNKINILIERKNPTEGQLKLAGRAAFGKEIFS